MQCISCSLIFGMWGCRHQLRTWNISQSENVWYGLQQSKTPQVFWNNLYLGNKLLCLVAQFCNTVSTVVLRFFKTVLGAWHSLSVNVDFCTLLLLIYLIMWQFLS
jgi:hypothetical protein